MFGPKTCIFDRALPLAMLCAHLVAVSPAWAGPAIKAADAIDPIGVNAYEAGSLLDRDLRTAWCTKTSSAQPPWITIEYETHGR